jgi:DNA replication protein DnaC
VERWEEIILPKEIAKLSPRIQADIKRIPWPKDMPTPIESTYLYGNTEVGKTIGAVFMMLEESKQLYLSETIQHSASNLNCVFISCIDLFELIKKSFNSDDSNEKSVLDYYKECHLLVLDDFGTVKPTDWVLQTLYSLINYRYEYMKKTIFTSNFSLDELAYVLGDDRITSRIARMGSILKKSDWKTKSK